MGDFNPYVPYIRKRSSNPLLDLPASELAALRHGDAAKWPKWMRSRDPVGEGLLPRKPPKAVPSE
jgi:hypothetical protein